MSEFETFPIGSRVRDVDGFVATVRYVGPVPAAKNKTDIWLGVEWDDQIRGKHDGSCVDEKGDYHRLFNCVNGAGSFLKSNKLTVQKTFLGALNDRYVSIDAPEIAESDTTLPNVFVSTLKGNNKSVEFIGEKHLRKRQQIKSISNVTLVNDNVSSIDSNLTSVSHLVEVSLQNNLLWRWHDVALLGSELPNLAVLLLHGNKLQTLTTETVTLFGSSCFQNLRVLALNGTNIRCWQEVQLLEPFLPAIEELYLANNAFPDLPRSDAEQAYQAATGIVSEPVQIVHGFPTLRLLDVSNCKLDEWSQVLTFGRLLNLQELVLDNNLLAKVTPVQDNTFARLHRFSLSGNPLSTWRDVDLLALCYPQLRVLRLSQIPLFDGRGASEVRPIMIARIGQLTVLNGSQIGPRERTDAERAYLRSVLTEKIALTRSAAANADESFSVEGVISVSHPRFSELTAKYAVDIVAAEESAKAAGPQNLAAELIKITLRNMSFKSNGSLEPLVKRLPKSLTVSHLKMMVKQIFGLENRLQQLSMRLYKDSVPFVLDDDESTIEYFGAIDGAEIFINESKA